MTHRQYAGEHEMFARNAFDRQIGKTVPWRYRREEGGEILAELGTATLIKAEVADDGLSVLLTLDYERTP